MTRPFDRHLDSDELDRLVSLEETSVSGSEQLSEPALREAQRHVESCHDCSRKLQRHLFVHSEILRMRVPDPSPSTPQCMGDAEWLEVAAGLLPEAKTRELMKHAAQCGHCGPLLKNAAEALVNRATPSEEALLASLQSARPEWRKNMAATLRDSVRDRQPKSSWWRPVFTWPAPAYVLAGIVAVALIAWVGVKALHPLSAEQMLAQAYTEQRTFEPRIPRAKYAPLRLVRSGSRSNLDKPAALLKAEALIGENLSKNPNDPDWLQARARADLLDGNYDSAIKTSHRILEMRPNSFETLIDLGSAYFLRAQANNRPPDYGMAVEFLTQALRIKPDDPVALFNRALACEQIPSYKTAIEDWEHYLRIDPQSDWSNEARQKLAALEKHQQSRSEPLLNSSQIAQIGAHNPALIESMNARVEEYIHRAITQWLPTAYPQTQNQEPSGATKIALSALAEILWKRHNDSWLTDLLNHSGGKGFSAGVAAMAESVNDDDRGDYSAAHDAAHRAVELFQVEGNQAGELRALGEEVYTDQLLWEGKQCIALLQQIRGPLDQSSYRWLQAQMSLEESNCANRTNDLETYQTAITRGVEEAKQYKYDGLYLRALGFKALSAASMGDANDSFTLASVGLKQFWSEHIELMKGYNLYYDMDAAAADLNLPNLEVILWREATELIDQHPDILLQAMAHRWYANAAYLAKMPELGTVESANARERFEKAPKTPATERDYTDAEIWLAQVEIRQGSVRQAAQRLQAIHNAIEHKPSFDLEIAYYTAQADVAMHDSDPGESEKALVSAISQAESALTSLSSESDRRKWAEQTQSAYRDAVEFEIRQGNSAGALEFWEWYRGAELKAHIDQWPDPSESKALPAPHVVTNHLPLLRDETVIVYGVFPDGVALWAYDDRGISLQWISAPSPAMKDQVVQFWQLCADPASDLATLHKVGGSLYQLLVAPIEDRLTAGRTIVFEPDDFLTTVPWEALVDARGHYLVERSPVIIAPGLYRTQAMQLRSSVPIKATVKALVVSVANPPEADVPALVDVDSEARAVADRFSSAHQLKGEDASLSAVDRELPGTLVFHFAGHAVASSQRSGLLLGKVEPRTPASQTPHAQILSGDTFPVAKTQSLQLAVLSACETAGGNRIAVAGNESLAETLVRANVPHVIASRWKVDSRETAEYMGAFYTELLAGNSVSQSIHKAQLTLASQSSSAHPYYWAAFELTGRN